MSCFLKSPGLLFSNQGISASQKRVSPIITSFSKGLHVSWLEVASVNIFHDQINEKILPWIAVLVSAMWNNFFFFFIWKNLNQCIGAKINLLGKIRFGLQLKSRHLDLSLMLSYFQREAWNFHISKSWMKRIIKSFPIYLFGCLHGFNSAMLIFYCIESVGSTYILGLEFTQTCRVPI